MTDEEIDAAAQAMMQVDWAASGYSRPPNADIKTYYAMARAALEAAEAVRATHRVTR